MSDTLEEAVVRLYEARLRQAIAKEALREYRVENGYCYAREPTGEACPPCYQDWRIKFPDWCEVCQGSQPLWEARRRAATEAGLALRVLLRRAEKLANARTETAP